MLVSKSLVGMKVEWGKLIIEKRFGGKKKVSPRIQRCSATEYSGMEKLSEELSIRNKKISGGRPAGVMEEPEDQSEVDIAVERLMPALDFSRTIPPRTPHEEVGKEIFKEVEKKVFDLWKGRQKHSVFERNIEIWRQLWITCERSDVIIQIVDARNPRFFLNDDVRKLYPGKEHVLLVNKADLSPSRTVIEGYRCFYYSALDDNRLLEFILEYRGKTVGFVGYPNVGKSSTINSIMNSKRVKVSQTPGKTKHIQTIQVESGPCLLDCPGLVFPGHDKISLILHGILNVDQLLDLNSSLDYIVEFIGINKLCRFYSLRGFYNDSRQSKGANYINLMSTTKGWTASRCLKTIVKDFASGKIHYDKADGDDPEAMFDWYEKEVIM